MIYSQMSIYCIAPIGGSGGFKVHVTDECGGLRVVGVFPSEADAKTWIAGDSGVSDMTDRESAPLCPLRAQKNPAA
jgi:hypothetical protein